MCKKRGSQKKKKSQLKSNATHIQDSSESYKKEETIYSILNTLQSMQ